MIRTAPRVIAMQVRVRKGLGAVDPTFCRAIANGQILQSQVDIQTLFECSQAGIVGVQASPLSVVTAANAGTLPMFTTAQAAAPPPSNLPAPITVTQYLQANGTWTSTPPVAQQSGPAPQVKVTPWNPPAAASAPAPSSSTTQNPQSPAGNQQTTQTSPAPPVNDPNAGDVVLGTDAEHAFTLSDIPAQVQAKLQQLWAKAESIAPWYVWAGAAGLLIFVVSDRKKRRTRKTAA